MTGIKGVVFDLDGTLLDSMQVWAAVGKGFLVEMGIKPDRELFEALSARIGIEAAEYLRERSGDFGLDASAIPLEDWRTRMTTEHYIGNVAAKPGALELLIALKARGYGICAATATDRRLAEPALRKCGLLDYFSRVFTCGEEGTNKRSPEIYIRAASFLGIDIHETLVVEDSLHAIITASSAGFPVAAVYDLSSDSQQDEIRQSCNYYYTNFMEMLSEL